MIPVFGIRNFTNILKLKKTYSTVRGPVMARSSGTRVACTVWTMSTTKGRLSHGRHIGILRRSAMICRGMILYKIENVRCNTSEG
jgi:hypothetical protein